MADARPVRRAISRPDLIASRRAFLAMFQGLLFASISVGLVWIVSDYDNALRDPRYLDGWVLAGGMSVQLCFHIATRTRFLTPRATARWRKLHIFLGFLMLPAFLLHSNYSLPDTSFEWGLWVSFVLIFLSGLFGIYIAWSLKSRHILDDEIVSDRIPARRAELSRDVFAVVSRTDPAASTSALPPPPHDAWIRELYDNQLETFFERRRNGLTQLIGSRRPLKRLMDEIDHLSAFVDKNGLDKLAAIKRLVIEKDRLDAAHVALMLSRSWLFVHLPVTYAMVVLAVTHVVVVYSFSSGVW